MVSYVGKVFGDVVGVDDSFFPFGDTFGSSLVQTALITVPPTLAPPQSMSIAYYGSQYSTTGLLDQ